MRSPLRGSSGGIAWETWRTTTPSTSRFPPSITWATSAPPFSLRMGRMTPRGSHFLVPGSSSFASFPFNLRPHASFPICTRWSVPVPAQLPACVCTCRGLSLSLSLSLSLALSLSLSLFLPVSLRCVCVCVCVWVHAGLLVCVRASSGWALLMMWGGREACTSKLAPHHSSGCICFL
jgi:hypothetical protein